MHSGQFCNQENMHLQMSKRRVESRYYSSVYKLAFCTQILLLVTENKSEDACRTESG